MGPSLRTFELGSFCRSRGISPADEMVLRAVFDERDQLRVHLDDVVANAQTAASVYGGGLPDSIKEAHKLLAETEP